MEMKSIALEVRDSSQIAEARRLATTIGQSIGLNETMCGKLAIIVTESATNLIKHTPQGGQILVRRLNYKGTPGIEVLALDRGNGITNIGEALRDGYSTSGTR